MSKRMGPRLGLAAMVLVLGAMPMWAQQSMASINGTITDASGAAVPGAKVTATNQEQNTSFAATTNASGVYNLPRVPVGNYMLQATAAGFQTSKQGPFTLILGQTAQISLKLEVGQQSQTVAVTAAAPLLQTESTETSTNLNAATNSSLPLVTRNYVQLTLLSPGAVAPNVGNGNSRPYVNGNRAQGNNFLLDGLDNNQTTENQQGYTPTPDAIQEFNLVTSNASAEYGNFQGGIISVSIKSGTNNWHGDAWEYLKNDKLNANAWAHNWQGTGRAKIRWNDFGATMGGPILHDKLFIFGDYAGNRNDVPSNTSPITVFTAAERQGDFSALVDSSGQPVQLYDPTVNNGVNRPAYTAANGYAGFNMIPAAEISPVAQALFSNTKLYPLPINGNQQDNQLNTTRSYTNTNQGDVRVDWNMNSTNRIYVRGSMMRSSGETSNSFPLLLPTINTGHDYNVVADWTHSIGTNFVNEARLGFNYVGSLGTVGDNGLGNIAQTLGITDGNSRGPGLMALQFSGNGVATNLGNIDTNGLRGATVIEYEDQMIITAGRHLIHAGFEGMRYREDYFYGGNNGLWGRMAYNGQFTGAASNSTVKGAGLADFYLGLPYQIGRGPGTGVFGQRRNVIGDYVQDDWRATNSLTLNLGLRYQNFLPLYEKYNRQLNVTPIGGQVMYAGTTAAQSFYGDGRALYHPVNGLADFQPRLGFSWSPSGNTVIRGAYGTSTFMEGTGLNLRLTTNPPYGAEYQNNYSSLDFPSTTSSQGLSTLQLATNPFKNVTLRLWSPTLQPAVTEQWNFNIQRQLSNNTTIQIGYVGQHGTHLVTAVQLVDKVLPQDCSRLGGSIMGVTCDPNAISPSPYLSGNAALAGSISNVSATYTDGKHIYHSLQAVLQHRFSGGLQYQVAYTWSKCMSDSGGFYGDSGQASASGEIYAQNTYNRGLEYGPCFNDITHMISSYVVYALPFGTQGGPDLGAAGNYLLGHWNVSGTWQWHTGFAMSPVGPNNTGNGDFACCRLDTNGPTVYTDAVNPNGGIQWFSPNSFSPDLPGQYPTAGRGILRGPKLDTINLSLARDFPITESTRVQFRTDFNNLTNTPILNAPSMGYGTNLGRISSAQGERQIEFALKLFF